MVLSLRTALVALCIQPAASPTSLRLFQSAGRSPALPHPKLACGDEGNRERSHGKHVEEDIVADRKEAIETASGSLSQRI